MTSKEQNIILWIRVLLRVQYGHRGIERAVTAAQIGEELEIDERKVRFIIRELRLHGFPVAATPKDGFFWPETKEDTEHTHEYLWSLVNRIREVAVAFDTGVEREFGALTLFEEVGS